MRASTFHIRRPVSLASRLRWWSRRPWADELTIVDTTGYWPGRHHAAPLLPQAARRRKRVRSERPQDSVWSRPVQPPDRRGLELFASARRALQIPASVQLVGSDETARLEEARRRIAFVPTNGFLHSTAMSPLQRRALTPA